MQPLAFDKYEGLGNDFLVVEVPTPDHLHPDQARALCDRHFGVGADGVLLVSPPTAAGHDATLTILNADGSRPEMCGNGLRCVALHLANNGEARATYQVMTDAGLKRCDVQQSEPGGKAEVQLSMGQAQSLGPLKVAFEAEEHVFGRVSIGNPHAITFGPIPTTERIDRVAPLVSGAVAGGSNVEFADVQEGAIRLVVWERGVGRTLACGTGACATVALAAERGLVGYDSWVSVALPGGTLQVRVDPSGQAQLRGPARRVFSGSIAI